MPEKRGNLVLCILFILILIRLQTLQQQQLSLRQINCDGEKDKSMRLYIGYLLYLGCSFSLLADPSPAFFA